MNKNIKRLVLIAIMVVEISSCASDGFGTSDDIQVKYCLRNEQGEETTVFNYGENIIFELTLYNNGKYTVCLPDEVTLFSIYSTFQVYSIDGKYIGTPYSTAKKQFIPVIISSGKKRQYQSCWMVHWEDMNFPIFPIELKEPLPKGTYYSYFQLDLNDDISQCKVSFTIN